MAKAKITYEAPGADTVSGTLDNSKKIVFTGTPQKGQATFDAGGGDHIAAFVIQGTPGTAYKIELGGTGITPAPGQSPATGTIAANRTAATFIEFKAKALAMAASVGAAAGAVAGLAAASAAKKRITKKRAARKSAKKRSSARKTASKKRPSKKSAKTSARKSSRKSSKSRKGGRR